MQRRRGFGLGPRIQAGLRPRVGPIAGVQLMRRPLVSLLLGMEIEVPLNVEGIGVATPAMELLL